jgi:hypothetical protein
MARRPKETVIERLRRVAGKGRHPHLAPVHGPSLREDLATALGSLDGLVGYQQFLADARAAKAKRKRASVAFERSVQVQARRALNDLDAFSGAALRAIQQVNQTDLWAATLDEAAAIAGAEGVPLRDMWRDLTGTPQYRQALLDHGLSEVVLTRGDELMDKLEVRIVKAGTGLAVEGRPPGSQHPRRLPVSAKRGTPRSVNDLLQRTQFDAIVDAFHNDGLAYLELVPAPAGTVAHPADLFGFAVVAARQRMAEHVRKLEDTGLATYAGEDPASILLAGLIIGLAASLAGLGILYLCDHEDEVIQPEWLCVVGKVLFAIGFELLAAMSLLAFIDGAGVCWIAYFAFVLIAPQMFANFERWYVPGFSVQPA